MSIHTIILCGGPGARLWPASTAAHPKPFIDLLGDLSLFQRTVIRMDAACGGLPPLIVTGVAHVEQVRAQLDALGRGGLILAEPEGRDSGPALLAAALWIAREDPAAVAVAVASDHYIPDEAAFKAAVDLALGAARAGEIVTFGVKPSFAATGYGYIRVAGALAGHAPVARVSEFVEKPDTIRAERLVSSGCLWNSGNFMFQAPSLLAEARQHAPDLLSAVEAAVAGATLRGDVCRLGAAFLGAPKVSIDVAVMERTRRAAVLPIDYAWTDLGSWDAIWASSPRDDAGNAASGMVVAKDSENCLLRAGPGVHLVALGLSNLAVVAHDGNVLVSDLARTPELKPSLDALRSLKPASDGPPACSAGLAERADRHRAWLWDHALPLWWCFGADHQHGGYHEGLDLQDLAPSGASRRARVQARQAWVYATAGRMGWPGPWRAAARHGLDYLQRRYRRPDGLFRALVDPAGAPLDDTALLYDQAFVLLALAAAARAEPAWREEIEDRARDLLGAVRRTLSHPGGGFVASDGAPAFLANPHMHMFEAALAWMEVSEDTGWAVLADQVVALFFGALHEPATGLVREVFDAEWRPTDTLEGRTLEPGHHFEWAWLLGRWAARAGEPRAREAALRLYAAGDRGVEPISGLVLDGVSTDFSVVKATSRLWPQTERVKAALLLANWPPEQSAARMADARSALDAMELYFQTSKIGLWRDDPHPDAPHLEPSPASSFYHVVGAIVALVGFEAAPAGLIAAEVSEV